MPARLRIVLALAVLASVLVMAQPRTKIAPYGVTDPPPMVTATALVAVALLLVGVVLSAVAGPYGPGSLALLVAAALVAGSAVGATSVPALASSLSWLLAALVVPAVVQLTLSWPQGVPERAVGWWLVLGTWALVGVAGVARLAVWDPFADATCVLRCADNPVALAPDPELARTLLDALWLGAAVVCSVTAALVLRPRRFWIGGLACAVLAVDAVVRLASDGPVPRDVAMALFLARCIALALVGGALVVAAGTRLRRHFRLVRLATELDASPAPGTYEATLRSTLGDPTLRLTYPGIGGFDEQDATSPTAPPPSRTRAVRAGGGRAREGRATTVLVRSGTPVAVITHAPQHAEALAAALGPAARMAIDIERLQEHLRTRLAELRSSRERIVERSDSERLRLERDLHDGAQQRLLMIGYELARAADLDPDLAATLAPVRRDVSTALYEVRDLAHGIYPGILEALGLPAALGALADGPVPVVLGACPDRRLPAPVERLVYLVVSTALEHPTLDADGLPTPVTVALGLRAGDLELRLDGIGPRPAALVQRWEDRVGALGGTIRVSGPVLECCVPCA